MGELSTLFCAFSGCQKPFQPTNKRHRCCSDKCRAAAHYLPTKLRVLRRRNTRFRSRNRDRALGFDGRYGGPTNYTYLIPRTGDDVLVKNLVGRA